MIRRVIYVAFGDNAKYRNQLKYSVKTLHETNNFGPTDIVIYTDSPEYYAKMAVDVIDISGRMEEFTAGANYYFRVKPCVVLDALLRFDGTVLFLDTDTIVKGDLEPVFEAIEAGSVAINKFERSNPYPEAEGFEADLPDIGPYKYSTTESIMYNSGVIGVGPKHIPLLKQTLTLLDAMRDGIPKRHTIEQCALSEVLRLNGQDVVEVTKPVAHYWRARKKIFMNQKLAKAMAGLPDDAPFPSEKKINLNWMGYRWLELKNSLKSKI